MKRGLSTLAFPPVSLLIDKLSAKSATKPRTSRPMNSADVRVLPKFAGDSDELRFTHIMWRHISHWNRVLNYGATPEMRH